MRKLLFVSTAILVSSAVQANTVTTSADVPMTPTNWTSNVTVNRFDPLLGTLTEIYIAVEVRGGGAVQIESQDTVPTVLSTHVALPTSVLRPNSSVLVAVAPFGDYVDQAAAFDGIVDFAGTSGFTHFPFDPLAAHSVLLTSVADRALFTGAIGNPGTITLPVQGTESITVTTSGGTPFVGAIQDSLTSSAEVTVTYVYTPGVGAPFCAGDGSGTACPCGNSSAVGANQGCANVFGTGAHLAAAGAPDVLNDSLTLQCSGLPSGTTAVLFQGTQQENFGSGAVFGDGLRCVSGSIHRLGSTSTGTGVATWPLLGALPLSVSGGAQSGQLLHYQVWYRNAAAFCTPSTFNLSQGLSVAWVM